MSLSGRRGACCLAAAAILMWVTAVPAPGSQGEMANSEQAQAGVPWKRIGATTLDVCVLRPLGAAATAAGFGLFLVTSPVTAASQRIGMSWDILVRAPADYTIQRPLGDF